MREPNQTFHRWLWWWILCSAKHRNEFFLFFFFEILNCIAVQGEERMRYIDNILCVFDNPRPMHFHSEGNLLLSVFFFTFRLFTFPSPLSFVFSPSLRFWINQFDCVFFFVRTSCSMCNTSVLVGRSACDMIQNPQSDKQN